MVRPQSDWLAQECALAVRDSRDFLAWSRDPTLLSDGRNLCIAEK